MRAQPPMARMRCCSIVDEPPDLVVCDYRMPGLDGRQLYEKLRTRQQTKQIPFIFLASRSDIEEKLRPIVEGVEEFIPKPFFLKDVVRRAKKVIDRLQLEKLQNRAVRPGVIQGRLEEMSILDLMQSLEMGQKSCRLTIRRADETGELFFSSGQCTDAKLGKLEGEAAVYESVRWPDGEFEIDFNAGPYALHDLAHHHRPSDGSAAPDGRTAAGRHRRGRHSRREIVHLTSLCESPFSQSAIRLRPENTKTAPDPPSSRGAGNSDGKPYR